MTSFIFSLRQQTEFYLSSHLVRLPVGGFRSSQPVTKNSNADQGAKSVGARASNRFSREINQSDTNTNPRTSVISSNLSDTRILHEVKLSSTLIMFDVNV